MIIKMKWSPSVQGFFSDNSSNQPSDAIFISDALYLELMNGQGAGKIITNDKDGLPMLIDYPEKTPEQEIAEAEAIKKRLIGEANDFMNSKQWPGKAAIHRLKDEELDKYAVWLDYLDALEAVDTSSTPEIIWPVPPSQQA